MGTTNLERERVRRAWLPAALLGLLLSLPALDLGFFLDDYFLLDQIESSSADGRLNLYHSFEDSFPRPWWTSDELQISFWRPFSSALIWLDHALWGRWAPGYHAHSLLWMLALIAAAGLLYRRLPRPVAWLALVLFAIDESHAVTGGVICNRHALVSTVAAALGLAAHLRWREQGWRPGLPASLAAFALGLAAGETAIAGMAYVASYELFAGPGTVRRRALALAPLALLAASFTLWHAAMGYGVSGTSFYLDPTGRPLDFLATAAARIPTLLAAALTALPASLWAFEAARPWQIATGIAAVVTLAILARYAWGDLGAPLRRELRWWVPGAAASMLPVAAAPPADRQLLVPALGFAVLVASILAWAWRRWRAGRRRLAGPLLLVLGLMHLVAAPLSRPLALHELRGLDRGLHDLAAQLPELVTDDGRPLVLVNAPNLFTVLHLPAIRWYDGQRDPMAWNVLSLAPHDQRLIRADSRTLVLEVSDGEMLTSLMEQVLRPLNDPVAAGEDFETELFRAEILELGETGPTRVAFRFVQPLEELEATFLRWDGEFRILSVPAVGDQVLVTVSQGPDALL